VEKLLIFPSNLVAALGVAAEARRWGWGVIGASSLADDPNAGCYDGWARIPYIDDPAFFDALHSVVDRFGVTAVRTPHAPSYLLLREQLSKHLPELRMLGDSPYERQMRHVQRALAGAAAMTARVAELTGRPSPPEPGWLAALVAQANAIYGECSDEKLLALCTIFASAPKGDIVEIGSFFGKSAYILNRLAHRHGNGLTLAIDPWDMEISIQRDAPETIQALSRVWDWERVFAGFLLTMQACAAPLFNYIRATSAEAHARYRPGVVIDTPEFGGTPVAGSIAVLHIDGNHDEAAVAEDFALWSPHLAPGGWVVFDDYQWSQGDGPRRVADRALADYGDRVRRRFVAGGALFINVA
jgi:hypothetical protein